MSVTITTSSGSRTINQARVVTDRADLQYSILVDEGKQVLVGDGGIIPSGLVIELYLQEDTIEATGGLAQTIIDEAKVATSVTTPRGDRAVDGILSHALSSDGVMVVLRLVFAPSGGVYT